MSTLTITESYLKKRGAFKKELPDILEATMQLLDKSIPNHLRLSISLSELITLTSHMRKNIKLHDDTLVPCNAFSIGLYASGVSKDSSMNKVRKAFQPAYDAIEVIRKKSARAQAEQLALDEGESSEEWLNYYTAPAPLHVGLGTVEGLTNHFALLEANDIGAAAITNSEIGSELANNMNFMDIAKTLAIGFDLGKVPIKVVKAVENRVGAIECLPINALFFGSEDAILYDTHLKAKFSMMFNIQFARRGIFTFSKQRPVPKQYTAEEDIIKYYDMQRKNSKTAKGNIEAYLVDLVEFTKQTPLTLTREALIAFDMYLEYNNNVAEATSSQYPITKLARKHKQWLALKMSGNFAILDGSEEVEEEHFIAAINVLEELAGDLTAFETELKKETYELFADYCKLHIEDEDKLSLNVHELRKLGYVPTTGNYKLKMEELIELVSIYDPESIYTTCDGGICYERIIKDSSCGLSLLEFQKHEAETDADLKSRMSKSCESGYEFYESDFTELSGVLTKHASYSPFLFRNGKRLKSNVEGRAKWIVLDIDDSAITDEEAHLLLSDINHHIARTSDSSNPFKFRIMIELDMQVDIPNDNWRYFIESISDELGITADLLPKAQIYFAYGAETVLSVIDASPLEVRQHIMNASQHKKPVNPTTLTKKVKEGALADSRETFNYAYEAADGEGSRSLVKAGLHAIDLGADADYVDFLINDINTYWVVPMDQERIDETVLSYIHRKLQEK